MCMLRFLDNMNGTTGQCLYGGVRTDNNVCVHGYLIELLKHLLNKLFESGDGAVKGWDDISLWYTNSTVTKVELDSYECS
jgi:hypothetical protein